MKPHSLSTKPSSASQSGVMLVEVMIAVLIFAFGILGIVGLQGAAVKQVTDAKYRSDACFLANQLIGTMWTGDRTAATMQNQFNTGNPAYLTWKGKVLGTLPGVASNPPVVVVGNDGTTTITIQWLAPNEPAGSTPHTYVAVAQIK
jgi:type IV pilus assembly protein PilV